MKQRRYRPFLVLAPAIALVTVALWVLVSPSRRESYTLTLTAGSELGIRHRLAMRFREEASRRSIELKLAPTTGSREALELVAEGSLDLALVQGGLPFASSDSLREVAVLGVEPLHVLCKADTQTAAVGHVALADLSGRLEQFERPKINLGSKGSGTNILAGEVLRFFGLHEGKDFEALHLSYADLVNETTSIEDLPDAVFIVSSLPSPVASHLIRCHGYRLVDLPVAEAFRIRWLSTEQQERSLAGSPVDALIPAFTYQINPPVPDRDLHTLGTRLHLVGHESVPPEAVEALVELIYTQGFPGMSNDDFSLAGISAGADFELHEGTAEYLENKTPIITEQLVSVTEQVVAIVGAVLGGFLFLWQTVQYTRRKKRDQQFLRCIERVSEIERRAFEYERRDDMALKDLLQLQDELTAIRDDMVGQFQRGDIEGADTLSGFLIHVNDANENLTRMILHEREPRNQ